VPYANRPAQLPVLQPPIWLRVFFYSCTPRLRQRHIIDLSVIIRLRNPSLSPAYSLVLSIPPLRRHITSHISYGHRCKIPWSLDFLSTYGTIYLWNLEQPLRCPYVCPILFCTSLDTPSPMIISIAGPREMQARCLWLGLVRVPSSHPD
jgi:hypothetical protein